MYLSLTLLSLTPGVPHSSFFPLPQKTSPRSYSVTPHLCQGFPSLVHPIEEGAGEHPCWGVCVSSLAVYA